MPAISSEHRAAIITALQGLRRALANGPQQSFPEGIFTVANDRKFAKDKRQQRAVEIRLAAKAVQEALHLVGPVQYAPTELQCPWRILNADLYHLDYLPASGTTLRTLNQSIEDLGGQADNEDQGDDPNFRHSADFRSVVWSGTSYTFTRNQAACIKVLWAAWERKTPELDGLTVVTQADVSQTRLIDVFRSKGKAHLAWGTMIVQGKSKGACRLCEGSPIAPTKPRRKQSRRDTRKTHR